MSRVSRRLSRERFGPYERAPTTVPPVLERLKHIALAAIGAVALLVKMVLGRSAESEHNAQRILRHLATRTSAALPELSSQAFGR